MNWNNVIKNVDNWIYLILAVFVLIIAKYCEIPLLNGVAMACMVKMKEANSPAAVKRSYMKPKNTVKPKPKPKKKGKIPQQREL